MNLGIAYADLSIRDRRVNPMQAIACYQQALRFCTPETAPAEYAITQVNLGNSYLHLLTGDRGVNLMQAIAYYQQALLFWKPETAPFDYAITQNNLGTAYAQLPTGDRGANLAQAIACYEAALRFRTPEAAPGDCRTTNRNLADLYFSQQDWDSALIAYQAAMDAGERLYRAGLSTESKATEVAQNAHLYRHAAFAATHLRNAAEALLILEHGKTRLLTEALRLRVPRPVDVPDDVWNAFERAGAAVRTVQFRNTTMFGEERDPVQAYDARIQNAKAASAALDATIEQVRAYAPDFLKAIDLPSIQALLPDEHTALMAFCITDQGSMVFVMSHASGEPVQLIELSDFTQANLTNLLIERDTDGKPTGGWLVDYWSQDQSRWQHTMDHVLAQVGKQLIASVVATLPAGIQKLILLPTGGLFLLPLHAVPLSDGDSDRLCDRYQISYAPSAEVLANSQIKTARAGGQSLYAVINPEADPRLVFTPVEGAAIAGLFTTRQIHEGQTGTKEAVVAGLHGRNYLHVSCHGSYNWNDPPESGLALADGRLTLAELQSGTVDLSAARLVTLSACETGISDIFQGSAEEYVGLPAGFMLAGVPCVVSSLWAVPDISTALLMERFYRNHLEGEMDFPVALQEAQAWVRQLKAPEVMEYAENCYQQSKPAQQAELFKYIRHYRYQAKTDPTAKPFAHPYYWAAFTVNGM